MNWLVFDPTPIELRWVDLIVLPLIASVFIAGWLFGRRAEVQRRVDAVLRRETRPRHPSADIRAEALALIDALPSRAEQIANPERAREAVRSAHQQLAAIERRHGLSKADSAMRGVSAHAAAEAFSAAVRQGPAPGQPPMTHLCGKPVVHSPEVGDWPCVLPSGHMGGCV